ncbi:MAG: SRPBCC domain-containing protein, partial [Myxococcota bacterium]
MEELRVSTVVHASPNRIYQAWMDERLHSAFTGQRATVDQWVGGRLTAAGDYIDATHVALETGRRIVLTWRTADFPLDAADSKVEISFEPVAGGTRVVVHHTDIPDGQSEKYKKTWRTVYLEPMKKFFASKGAAKRAVLDAGKRGVLPTPGERRRGRRPILGPRPGRDAEGKVVKTPPKPPPPVKEESVRPKAATKGTKKPINLSAKKPTKAAKIATATKARKSSTTATKKAAKKTAAAKKTTKKAAKKTTKKTPKKPHKKAAKKTTKAA